jgi:hypothetical protein
VRAARLDLPRSAPPAELGFAFQVWRGVALGASLDANWPYQCLRVISPWKLAPPTSPAAGLFLTPFSPRLTGGLFLSSGVPRITVPFRSSEPSLTCRPRTWTGGHSHPARHTQFASSGDFFCRWRGSQWWDQIGPTSVCNVMLRSNSLVPLHRGFDGLRAA